MSMTSTVRSILKDKPNATTDEVIALAAKQGVVVKKNTFYTIKHQLKMETTPQPKSKKIAKKNNSPSNADVVSAIKLAKQLLSTVDRDNAISIIKAL